MAANWFIAPTVKSPWWPLAVAEVLGRGHAPGVYQLGFHDWVLWHYAFHLRGVGFLPAPATLTLDTLPEAA